MHASIPSLRPIVSRCNRDRTSLATPAAFLAPTEPFPPPPSRSIAARAICLRVDEWNYGGLESGSAIKRRNGGLTISTLSLSLCLSFVQWRPQLYSQWGAFPKWEGAVSAPRWEEGCCKGILVVRRRDIGP